MTYLDILRDAAEAYLITRPGQHTRRQRALSSLELVSLPTQYDRIRHAVDSYAALVEPAPDSGETRRERARYYAHVAIDEALTR